MTRLLTIFLSVLLTSCSLFPEPSVGIKKYVLDPTTPSCSIDEGSAKHIQLVVEAPALYPPLDNARVAVKPAPQQLDYLAEVEWADRLSGLIQDSIIYSIENTEHLKMVGRPADGASADYTLRLEVRKFHIEDITATKGGVATIEYRADLMTLPGREVSTSHTIQKRVRCPVDGVDGLMQSLNIAHGQATSDLINWLLNAMPKKGKKYEKHTAG